MRRKNKNKILKAFLIFTFIFLGTAYAAFNTNINLSAKGNVKTSNTIETLKTKVVESGDGLYLDKYTENKYVYKGTNPDNYIKIDSNLYRIISIENNALKVIKKESVLTNVLDKASEQIRYSENAADYCHYDGPYYGCNVWGSKYTMLDKNENSVTQMAKETFSEKLYNLPEKEAYLNTYLNETWYDTLSSKTKEIIAIHSFNVGPVNGENEQLTNTVKAENEYKWKGKVALASLTDFVNANSNPLCETVYANTKKSDIWTECQNTNWLYKLVGNGWLITPVSSTSAPHSSWHYVSESALYSSSSVGGGGLFNTYPVFYITKNITLKGSGQKDTPYELIG